MQYNPSDILLMDGIFPRKRMYWTGVIRPSIVQIENLKIGELIKQYVIANEADEINEIPIYDFEILKEIIQIGHYFTVNEDIEGGIEIITKFVKQYGIPFRSAELLDMPKEEECRLKALDAERFLNEIDSWYPRDGCSLPGIILSCKFLYKVWNLWCQHAFPSYEIDPFEISSQLQDYLNHGSWSLSVGGDEIIHTPRLVHSLKYEPNTRAYRDYYASNNLFCIVTDQLYSFIADYESGKYACIKECPVCGRAIRVSGNQKYCSECADEIKTQKSTERSKRYREKRKTATKPTPAQ